MFSAFWIIATMLFLGGLAIYCQQEEQETRRDRQPLPNPEPFDYGPPRLTPIVPKRRIPAELGRLWAHKPIADPPMYLLPGIKMTKEWAAVSGPTRTRTSVWGNTQLRYLPGRS